MFLEIDGIRKPLADWADENGLTHSRVHARLRAGWDQKNAITVPTGASHGS